MKLDGTLVANRIKQELRSRIAKFKFRPKLSVCLIGADEGSQTYVAGKQRACESLGIDSSLVLFPSTVEQAEVEDWIRTENESDTAGLLIQLPLPPQLDRNSLLR